MTMGEKLRQARIAAKLSQRQLCEGIITRNMLSQIENGSAKPSLSTLQALAQRLETSVQYFLEEDQTLPCRTVAADMPQDDGLLLSWAIAAVREDALERAEHLLAAVKACGSEHWHFAKGSLLAARGEYQKAAVHLRKGEPWDPAAAWALLEICCRETGDYQGAYLYACKRRDH